MLDEITVVKHTELDAPDGTSDVSRQVLFETDDTIMIQSRVGGDVTTGWHHNGDRHVFGCVVQGLAALEYGPGGRESVDLSAGDFVYVPPNTIRRVVNPTTEDWVVVICFVGSGPPATAVEGPAPE